MKVEVFYESFPYKVVKGLVMYNQNGISICRQVIEVDGLSDVFKAIEEDGFSNHIMFKRVLNDDGTVNKEVMKTEFSEKLDEILKNIDFSNISNKLPNLNGNIYNGLPEIKFMINGEEI